MCAGGLIAASFLAFLSMLGVIPRLAGLTKSMKNARMYESFVALEDSWDIGLSLSMADQSWIPLLVLYGLFGGILDV